MLGLCYNCGEVLGTPCPIDEQAGTQGNNQRPGVDGIYEQQRIEYMRKTPTENVDELTQEQRLQIVERFIAQMPNVDELTQEQRNEIEIVALAFIDHLQEQKPPTRG